VSCKPRPQPRFLNKETAPQGGFFRLKLAKVIHPLHAQEAASFDFRARENELGLSLLVMHPEPWAGCSSRATFLASPPSFDARGLQMTSLYDVSEMLKRARSDPKMSQEALAQSVGVSRSTVARMETLAKGDMSVSTLVRLLEAPGYDLKLAKAGHERTIEDILIEQRSG
jgi:DNA-binding XRE family transcriptional regulator